MHHQNAAKKIESVAIVGTGIAGLSMAACLKNLDCQVKTITMFEAKATPTQADVGGIVTIGSGSAVLQELGLMDKLGDISRPLDNMVCFNESKREVLKMNIHDFVMNSAKELCDEDGHPMIYSVKRADLQTMLFFSLEPKKAVMDTILKKEDSKQSASDDKISIQFIPGKKVREIREDEHQDTVTLVMEDKEHTQYRDFDLIIGADGIHSMCRKYILNQEKFPIYNSIFNINKNISSGYRVVQCITSVSSHKHKINLQNDYINNTTHWFGKGCDAMIITVGKDDEHVQYMLYLIYPDANTSSFGENTEWKSIHDSKDHNEADMLHKNLDNLVERGQFANREDLRQIINASFDHKHGGNVYDMGVRDYWYPLPTWSSMSGKVILVGDSAHAMSPFMGQGANQALQDTYCLANKIKNYNEHFRMPSDSTVMRVTQVATVKAVNAVKSMNNKLFDEMQPLASNMVSRKPSLSYLVSIRGLIYSHMLYWWYMLFIQPIWYCVSMFMYVMLGKYKYSPMQQLAEDYEMTRFYPCTGLIVYSRIMGWISTMGTTPMTSLFRSMIFRFLYYSGIFDLMCVKGMKPNMQ